MIYVARRGKPRQGAACRGAAWRGEDSISNGLAAVPAIEDAHHAHEAVA